MTVSLLPDQATAWHTLTASKVLLLLQSDRQLGLSTPEVLNRQRYYGANELEESGGRNAWEILLDQFSNVMLLMLIGVAVISGILDLLALWQGKLSGEVPFKDTIAIALIVLLNGILGYVQESRAEKALAALKKLSSPRVRVVRDGKLLEIAAKELVPGDIVQIEAGIQVPADGRVLEAANLQVREAALTGEAHAVNKQVDVNLAEDTPLGDRVNLLFQGTEVVHGRGTMVVTRIGMQTELGRIATLIQSVEAEPTPLQARMTQLSQVLVTGSLLLVAVVV
ncbi:MAG: HAD-IC family P-type ATPase, partial [Cyanobacteria bacterium]|nr:HAD-IC family P-type ATPase [Cyanobacteriota bacterium]MDW8202130.1 HAD-IC family P-type ATPase [Cyanobacteriota bacterium SKYGB_h_bin112]